MRQITSMLIAIALIGGLSFAQQPNTMNDYVWAASNGAVVAFDTTGTAVTMHNPSGNPAGIAMAANGHVYIARNAGSIYHASADGATVNTYTVGTAPYHVAIDGDSNVWVSDSSAPNVYKMGPTGTVLLTLAPNGAGNFYASIGINSFDEVWCANNTDGNIYVYDTAGVASTFSPIDVGSSPALPYGVAMDRSGNCWITYQDGVVYKFDRTNGNVLFSITTGNPLPVGIAVSANGSAYVANADSSGTVNLYSSGGTLIQTTAIGATAFGVSLDGNGDVWVASSGANQIYKLDRFSLSPLGDFAVGSNFFSMGDATGYAQANVLHQSPSDDFDADTVSNTAELDAGTNPFDSMSTPSAPRPIASGVPTEGATTRINFRFAADSTLGYAAGASLNLSGPSGYIQVPNTARTIPLEDDAFYRFAMNNFWHFQGFGGFLDGNGDAYATINIPSASGQLVGTTFYVAFVTLDNNRPLPIITISNTTRVTIQ